jgi:hypothetical protein
MGERKKSTIFLFSIVQGVVTCLLINFLSLFRFCQAVKKLLCQQLPRPSQCILNRTLNKENIVPIVNKVALQINCKLGGELWAIENTIPGVMFVGMDVYHDKAKRHDSVLGFVSSANDTSTQYYAQVSREKTLRSQFRIL